MSGAGSRWSDKLKRVRHSIASSGLRRTLADIAVNELSYDPEQDASFDARFGTDTAGSVQPRELGIADEALREKAILYLPSPARVTRWMLRNVAVDHSESTFVDLGCGKGRVLLIASEFPFRAVHGVDISSELSETARGNAALYQPPERQCDEIHVHNSDATRFDFPPGNLLIHLYHPFDPELSAAILRRLGDSLGTPPRRVVVAYLLYTGALAAVERAFASAPWLTRVRYEQSVTGQYDWLFYSN